VRVREGIELGLRIRARVWEGIELGLRIRVRVTLPRGHSVHSPPKLPGPCLSSFMVRVRVRG
jgi:hypothetical protein